MKGRAIRYTAEEMAWLEENLPDASISWLAVQIVEAHERATKGNTNGG